MQFVCVILDSSTRGKYIFTNEYSLMTVLNQAVYKMSVAASLTKPDPLTAEECTNRIFVRLDKDENGNLRAINTSEIAV